MTLEELFTKHVAQTHPGANEDKVQELRRIFFAGLLAGFAEKEFASIYTFGARTKAASSDRKVVTV